MRPGETLQSLTERAAASFAAVAQALRERGHGPSDGHFVNRLVFCMFTDDVGLLPDHMFTRMLRHAQTAPAQFSELTGELFRVMAFGGRVGFETVAWFNGGLFDDADALPLERSDAGYTSTSRSCTPPPRSLQASTTTWAGMPA